MKRNISLSPAFQSTLKGSENHKAPSNIDKATITSQSYHENGTENTVTESQNTEYGNERFHT